MPNIGHRVADRSPGDADTTRGDRGQEGDFDAEQAVRIILNQPDTAMVVVRQLYRWLISESTQPDDDLIQPLAKSFAEDYDIKRLVERMLRSNIFFSDMAYRQRIKNPIEFSLGIVRPMQGRVSTATLASDLSEMGQTLYQPTTLHGWPDGTNWLNASTVIARNNLALDLISGAKRLSSKIGLADVAKQHGHTNPRLAADFFLDLLLQSNIDQQTKVALEQVVNDSPDDDDKRLQRVVHLITTLPEFQLA